MDNLTKIFTVVSVPLSDWPVWPDGPLKIIGLLPAGRSEELEYTKVRRGMSCDQCRLWGCGTVVGTETPGPTHQVESLKRINFVQFELWTGYTTF